MPSALTGGIEVSVAWRKARASSSSPAGLVSMPPDFPRSAVTGRAYVPPFFKTCRIYNAVDRGPHLLVCTLTEHAADRRLAI